MTTALRYGIVAAGTVAFLGAVATHLGTFFDYRLVPAGRETVLAVGAMVLLVATAMTLRGMAQLHRAASWQFSLAGAPGWLRYGLLAILAYGVLNFFLVPFKRHSATGDAERSLLYLRLWSGHVLFLYLAPVVAIYSAIRMEHRGGPAGTRGA
jgi:hypothetical protein